MNTQYLYTSRIASEIQYCTQGKPCKNMVYTVCAVGREIFYL